VIALLVDGPANGTIYRDVPGNTWIIHTHTMHVMTFVFGEPAGDDKGQDWPAMYVRTAKGDGESATFQFQTPSWR